MQDDDLQIGDRNLSLGGMIELLGLQCRPGNWNPRPDRVFLDLPQGGRSNESTHSL